VLTEDGFLRHTRESRGLYSRSGAQAAWTRRATSARTTVVPPGGCGGRGPSASIGAVTSDEAEWNFAYWLQNFEGIIPDIGVPHAPPIPPHLNATGVQVWLTSLPLYFGNEEEPEDDHAFTAALKRGTQVTDAFVTLCVRVARRLYAAGVIEATFGRPVPIIVHELEYYDTIAYQTRAANPPGVAQEFEEWVLRRR